MSGTLRRLLLAAGGLALLGLVAIAAGYWYLMSWADQPIGQHGKTVPATFILEPGQTLSHLASHLEQNAIISERRRLLLLGRLSGLDTRLQAGEYALEPGLTPRELLLKLNRGDVVSYELRIEEGVTVADVLVQLASEPRLVHEVQASDVQTLHDELQLRTPFAEGAFFPDTYHFRRGDSDRQLLLRAHDAMFTLLQAMWASRNADVQLRSPEEALILASIVEKETGLATDRHVISQVFHNRLRKNMRLQSDPTVIYALGRAFDGNLTRAHLKMESPFNTYRVRGLPPTPIALPSAASLEAAVHPAPGDYLYFVAKGDGASEFSRTLAEHNRAVRKYQLTH